MRKCEMLKKTPHFPVQVRKHGEPVGGYWSVKRREMTELGLEQIKFKML